MYRASLSATNFTDDTFVRNKMAVLVACMSLREGRVYVRQSSGDRAFVTNYRKHRRLVIELGTAGGYRTR